jgi:hypothetical protein
MGAIILLLSIGIYKGQGWGGFQWYAHKLHENRSIGSKAVREDTQHCQLISLLKEERQVGWQ